MIICLDKILLVIVLCIDLIKEKSRNRTERRSGLTHMCLSKQCLSFNLVAKAGIFLVAQNLQKLSCFRLQMMI